MNLLFISNLFPSSKQPTRGLYNLYLLEAFRNKGHLVEVINPIAYCPGIDDFFRKTILPPKVETFNELPVTHPTFFYTPGVLIEKHYWFYRLAIAKAMKTELKSLKERNAHSAPPMHVMLGFIYPDAVALAPVCQKFGLDYSIRVNGSDFRLRRTQPKFRSQIIKCLHEAPKIFCPGYRLKEDMVGEGIDEAKIHPFNNGVDPSTFYFSSNGMQVNKQDSRRSQEKTILFVGNLVDVKKVDRLLKAFAQMVKDQQKLKDSTFRFELRLDIVGNGPLRNKLSILAQTLGIERQVNFPGRELPQQIATRMRKADCLCLCSTSEGMPNVVVEALACGCPVVATDVGEVPYLIEDGINGYAIPTNGVSETKIIEELSLALDKALSQEWNRQSIAERMQPYTWSTAAKVIESALINKVL